MVWTLFLRDTLAKIGRRRFGTRTWRVSREGGFAKLRSGVGGVASSCTPSVFLDRYDDFAHLTGHEVSQSILIKFCVLKEDLRLRLLRVDWELMVVGCRLVISFAFLIVKSLQDYRSLEYIRKPSVIHWNIHHGTPK